MVMKSKRKSIQPRQSKTLTRTVHQTAPPGYKRTEVGVIPEDWDIKSLAEVCTPQGIVRGPFGGALRKEVFVDTGFKVYEQRNAIYKSYEIGTYFIDPVKYTEMRRFTVSPGDFIVSCSGTIGRIYQIPKEAPQGIINQALLKLTTNKEVVYDRYFYIYFEWGDFQRRIIDSTQGGAMKNLVGMHVFKTTPIVLPPIHEQHAIAEVLSDVDGLIEALDKLIAKKRAIKQAAMQELLTGKTRLPGFQKKPGYKNTEVGMIPKDWEVKSASDLFEIYAGGDFDPSRSNVIKDEQHLFPIYANGLENQGLYGFCSYADAKAGSVTVTARGTLGVAYYRDTPFTPIGRLLTLQPKTVLDGRFFAAYINTYVNFVVESTGVPQLTAPQIARYLLPCPPFPEQTAIATVLSDIDAEIEALERRREKVKLVKQGMMQQLLTGRIRLVRPVTENKETLELREV